MTGLRKPGVDSSSAGVAGHEVLADLLGRVSDGVFSVNRDFVYTYMNEAGGRLVGRTPESLVGRCMWDEFPEARGSVFENRYREALDTQQMVEFTEEFAPLGAVFSIRVFPSAGGLTIVYQDVTTRVRAEQEAAAARERFRLLAENASDIVVYASSDGVVRWVSPSLSSVLGWTEEQFVGRRAFEFLHPDDLPAILAAQGELALGEARDFEARVRTADGSYRWIGSHVRPVCDASGAIQGRVAGWRDIEAEHQARVDRATAEERFRLLAENASDVVYLVGPDRQMTWISPSVADALGWASGELLGTSMYELIHPEDRVRIETWSEAVFRGEHVEHPPGGWPARIRHKDGSYTWMALRTTTIDDENGHFAYAVTGMHEVDDLVRERERSEFEAARRQAIVETLLDPHVLLQSVRDETGTIVDFIFADANEAACEYNRVPRETLIGMRLLDLLPGHAGRGLLSMYATAVESGEPLILDDYSYPNEIQQQERYYDIRGVGVGDALSYTWRDVTERHEAARRLAESEARFRLLAENSTDVIVRSRDGLMRWLSPSLTAVLGWDPSEWVGHPFEHFTHPDDIGQVRHGLSEAAEGTAAVLTLRLRDKAGAYHWTEIHAGPFMDDQGHADGTVASFRVVDTEVASRLALSAAEEHYRLLAENSTDVVGRAREGRIAWISPSVTAALGGQPGDWIGRSLAEVIHPDDLPRHIASLGLRGDQLAAIVRARIQAYDGTYHWIEAHTGPFIDRNGNEDGVIASFRVIDDVVAAERELDYRARFDTLTGLANRKEILHRISGIASGTRQPGEYTAVLFCDLDRFKEVNDTYGHVAGDEVLRALAERISANVRQDDVTARIGGDELLVVLTGIHTMDEATAIAEKIRDAASVPIGLDVGRVTTTLSIGVTLVRPGESTDDLIARADEAMYSAKRQGRNQVVTIA